MKRVTSREKYVTMSHEYSLGSRDDLVLQCMADFREAGGVTRKFRKRRERERKNGKENFRCNVFQRTENFFFACQIAKVVLPSRNPLLNPPLGLRNRRRC